MNSKKTVAFATLGLLTGCGAAVDLTVPGSATSPELAADVPAGEVVDKYDAASDLERLAELNIIDMGRLVRDYPYGAMNCYGPCPGFEDEIAEADLRQAARLHELVEIADRAATVTLDVAECSVEVIDQNLAALDSLDIVEVFGLVEEIPVSSPYCYNLPCSGDILAAEEINCQRATALANIVEETTEL
jgi:hypothetical protein